MKMIPATLRRLIADQTVVNVEALAAADDPWVESLVRLKAVHEFLGECGEDDPVDASEGFTPRELYATRKHLGRAIAQIELVLNRVR